MDEEFDVRAAEDIRQHQHSREHVHRKLDLEFLSEAVVDDVDQVLDRSLDWVRLNVEHSVFNRLHYSSPTLLTMYSGLSMTHIACSSYRTFERW